MSTTERLLITGVAEAADELRELAISNEEYDLTQKELIDRGLVGERIFEYLYSASSIVLSDSLDPEKPNDYAPVSVIADGQTIGRIRPANTAHVRSLLAENRIEGMTLEIKGGAYRIVLQDGEDSFTTEDGTVTPFAALTLTIQDASAQEAGKDTDGQDQKDGTDSDSETVSFIDTSYAYEEKKEDLSRRGFVFLLLAAILTTFYLGFSFFYWRDILAGSAGADYRFGQILSQQYLTIHYAVVGAAFVLNVISVLCANCYLPLLAAICYLGSAAAGPQYILFTAIQALLCLLAAMRKRRGSVLLRVLLIPILLCAGTLAVLARLSIITEIPYINNIPAVSNIPLLQDISWFATGLPFQEATVNLEDTEDGMGDEEETEWVDEWDESWWEEESDGSLVFYDIEAESEYWLEDYEWESGDEYDEDEGWIELEDESDWYDLDEDESDSYAYDLDENESDWYAIGLEEDETEWDEDKLTEGESEANETLAEAETEMTYKTTANLNIRSTPGTDGEILGKLAAGEEVNVLSIQDGWAQIEYQNKTAYISEKYLTAP